MGKVQKRQFAFKTIDAPAGTDPVALNNADTLTLTTDSALTITGNSVARSLAFALSATGVSASTYGSASQVGQFAVDAQGRITSATNVTIDHGSIGGLSDDDHTQYIRVDGGRAFSANQSMGGFRLTSLGTPTASTDAVTKSYVDNLINGLDWKNSVRAASTGPITLSTGAENGDSFGGVTLSTGDRILIKDQSSAAENGIYIVQSSGAPVRADDANAWDELVNATVFVEEGTNADIGYSCTANSGGTLGVTSLPWVQISAAGSYVGGNGITITGNSIAVNHDGQGLDFSASQLVLELDGTTLSKSASGLRVASGGITNTEVNASAAIAYSKLATLTASRVLVSDGSGFVSASSVTTTTLGFLDATSSIQTQLNAKIGALAAVGASPNANGASISGATLNLQPADGTNPGVLTAVAQTIGGAKTLTGALTTVAIGPTTNNSSDIGSASLRYAAVYSNRIASYISTTVTPTVSGAGTLIGRFNNTGGGTTTVSVSSLGSNAANYLLGSVINTTSGNATFTVGGGGNFGGGSVTGAGSITMLGQANFLFGKAAGDGASMFTDLSSEGTFVYGEAFPGAVGAASISASGAAAAGCFVGGWIQGSDSSATASAINVSYFGCFAQGMIVNGGNIWAGATGLGPFAQGYATLLGTISSTGDGSFAQGYAEQGTLSASARGTVAHGAVVGSYSITASIAGAGAMGYANGANITASTGSGNFAFGYAYGGVDIVASGSSGNCFQFGRGTNSTSDSLQIGVSGTGVKIYANGQIDIPGVLNHDGSTIGFYAVTPVTRPTAYTQTYATATRTHSNLTSATLTDSTTGTANTTVDDVTASFSQTILNNNFADLIAQINALRVDLVNAKGVLNQVIDDLQAVGLLQ